MFDPTIQYGTVDGDLLFVPEKDKTNGALYAAVNFSDHTHAAYVVMRTDDGKKTAHGEHILEAITKHVPQLEAKTWDARVKVELKELREKIDALHKFTNSDQRISLSKRHAELLIRQYTCMLEYADILQERLAQGNG